MWDHYKDLLRTCPHHGLPQWMQLHHFYSDLTNTTRTLLDASAGGAMMSKNEDEAYKLLENMALNNCQWLSERVTPKKLVGMYDIDVFFNLAAQVSLLTKQIKSLNFKMLKLRQMLFKLTFLHVNFVMGNTQVPNAKLETLFDK